MSSAGKILSFASWPKDGTSSGDDLRDALAACKLDVRQEPKPIDFLFSHSGAGMLARANVHLLKGPEKAGKSAAGIALITAALKGEFLGITPAHENLSILWIDTEQDINTLHLKALAVEQMAGHQITDDRVTIYAFRSIGDPGTILQLVTAAVEDYPADLVFLDGVVDLCEAFNDEEKSRATVRQLEKLATVHNCAILGLLHMNAKDEKARGHLGSIMQQKACDVFTVTKEIDSDRAKWKQEKGRYARVPDIDFTFGDNFTIRPPEEQKTFTELESYQALSAKFAPLFVDVKQMRYTELYTAYAGYHQRSKETAKKAIAHAVRLNVLEKGMDGSREVYKIPFQDITPNDEKENV